MRGGGHSSDDSHPSSAPRDGLVTPRRLLVVSGLCAALLLGLLLGLGSVGGQDNSTSTTSNAPSRLFEMWLNAFNSGDPQRYATFLSRKFPFRGAGLSEDLQLRARTGGFDLLRLRHVSDTQVTGWLRERESGQLVEFELTLELYLQAGSPLAARVAARPYRIVWIEMRGGSVPPPYAPITTRAAPSAPPSYRVYPSITQDGRYLNGNVGQWKDADQITSLWQRCDPTGLTSCEAITEGGFVDKLGFVYKLDPAKDYGKRIVFVVNVVNPRGHTGAAAEVDCLTHQSLLGKKDICDVQP
jgi:hypothetical protein